MSDLLPCPFCGGTNLIPSMHNNGHETLVCIACEGCEAEGPCTIFRAESDKARAHSKWNRRPTPPKAGGGDVR